MSSSTYSNSIFWIEVEKIKPNPYQPRRDFDEEKLKELADSVRQYGILQPLVVTRKEVAKEDGGLAVEYELIAGERRLRAAKIAGLLQVPVIIRVGDDSKMKLELAIIENIQREDLNPVDRARAFDRLVNEFNFKHTEIAKKIGKSREYVSNSIRLINLPEIILAALSEGKITEGHSRPLMMLSDRQEEQQKLFDEILLKRMTVREAEGVARRIAQDRVRKKDRMFDADIIALEENLTETLGTRVQINKRENGGKITIDFFSDSDLEMIVNLIKGKNELQTNGTGEKIENLPPEREGGETNGEIIKERATVPGETAPLDDRSKEEIKKEEEDLYNIKNFSL